MPLVKINPDMMQVLQGTPSCGSVRDGNQKERKTKKTSQANESHLDIYSFYFYITTEERSCKSQQSRSKPGMQIALGAEFPRQRRAPTGLRGLDGAEGFTQQKRTRCLRRSGHACDTALSKWYHWSTAVADVSYFFPGNKKQ